jgi:hypothetical protein
MSHVIPLISMEYDDEDILDMQGDGGAMGMMGSMPKFPCGLQIYLTHMELDKFRAHGEDLDPADAFVGGLVHLFAMARITGISTEERNNGPTCRIMLQIESMGIESEDAEDGDKD